MIHAVYRVYALEWEHTLPLISMHDVSMLPSCRTTILSAALSVFKSRAAEASEISTPFYVANHSSVVSHMQPQRRHSPSQYSGNAVSTSTQLLHSSAMHPPIHYTPTHSTSPPCPRLSTSHNPSPPPTNIPPIGVTPAPSQRSACLTRRPNVALAIRAIPWSCPSRDYGGAVIGLAPWRGVYMPRVC